MAPPLNGVNRGVVQRAREQKGRELASDGWKRKYGHVRVGSITRTQAIRDT